jgi:hypothetical protein
VTSLSTFVVAQALNVPTTNFIRNGGFENGQEHWLTFDGTGRFAVNGGVMEYSRPGGTAVVLQNTGQSVAAGQPLVATWQMGNSSRERKRVSVLIHERSFADFSLCTFWLPPKAPLRPYAMRTHPEIAWTAATISLYAASDTSGEGSYRLDNVVFGPGAVSSKKRTDCIDPDGAAADDELVPVPALATTASAASEVEVSAALGISLRRAVLTEAFREMSQEWGGATWIIGRGALTAPAVGMRIRPWYNTVDNVFLSTLYERGLLGLALFVGAFMTFLVVARHVASITLHWFAPIALAVAGVSFEWDAYSTFNILAVGSMAIAMWHADEQERRSGTPRAGLRNPARQ